MNKHQSSTIVRIVAWSTVALVLLILLIGGMTGRLFRINWPTLSLGGTTITSDNYQHGDQYTAGGGSVPAAEIRHLDIQWVEGAVTVQPGEGDTITFSETSRRELTENQKLHYYVRDGKLYIKYCAPRISLNLNGSLGKSLTVTIPRELYLSSFGLEAVSATVELSGINADTMDIEAVSGSIGMQEIVCTSMDVEAVSGRVELSRITAGEMDIEGVSGSVEIEDSELGELSCSMVSGKFTIEPGANVRRISAETISGTLRIILPENDGFTARYSEGSGRFSCDFPVEMTGKRTAVYNGGGAEFELETVSGSLRIEKK